MAVEDGARLSGTFVALGLMIRAPCRQCSRKLYAPCTSGAGDQHLSDHSVGEVRHSRRCDVTVDDQLVVAGIAAFKKSHSIAEQDGDQVDDDLVEKAGFKAL